MIPELPEIPDAGYHMYEPGRLPEDRVAFVDTIHQQFLQSFCSELATYLDTPIEANPAGLEQAPLAKFLDEGASDCVVTLNMTPMRGQAWVGLTGGFLFRVLDILLGAPQTAVPAVRARITEIEQHVLREFFQALCTTLSTAWAPAGISLGMGSVGIADEVLQSADLDGTALILKSAVKFGEAEESFRVAVPVLAVRLAALQMEQKAALQGGSEPSGRAALLEVVSSATLQLEAVLRGSSIRLGDLAAMKPGQVLVLSQPAGSQLECLVNGKSTYRGEWIAHGDRHVLQVDAFVE